MLTSLAVSLAASAGWYGMRVRAELVDRDRLIAQLRMQNRDLLEDKAAADRRVALVTGARVSAGTTAAALGSSLDQVSRLRWVEPMPPIALEAALSPSPEAAQLAAALRFTLADRAAAQQRARVFAGEAYNLANSLNKVTGDLIATRKRFRDWVRQHYDALRGVLTTSGVTVDPLVKLAEAKLTAEGGPFIAPPASRGSRYHDTLVALPAGLRADYHAVDVVSTLLATLPLGMPAPGALEGSGFGVRTDPFTHRQAMHTGLDFSPGRSGKAYATAPGIVVHASREGAYGKLVEIRHGFGLSTRYAHLAKVEVEVGQRVDRGTELGVIGSTGRSTGRHLHYEVRVDGVAVDPADFLEARARLANVIFKE